jgi:hypothetical protein
MDYRQHQVEPQNQQDTYTQFNNVEFNLSFAGRKIEANTIRLLGEIKLTDVSEYGDFQIDNFVGAHTFINEVFTTTNNQGLIEAYSNYGRYEGMVSKAVNRKDNLFRSNQLCELKTFSPVVTGDLVKGVQIPDNNTGAVEATQLCTFSIRPNMVFNNVVGDQYISHNKTGDINISLRLARNEEFSYGAGNVSDTSYTLENLRVQFNSIPDDGIVGNHTLRSKTHIEQVINSNFSSLNIQVPAVCTGVSASLMESSKIGNINLNSHQQSRVPNIRSLQFLFNNSESEYITYEINNNVDVTQRYLESFAEVVDNDSNLEVLNSNKGFGIGLDFQSAIDLSSQTFGILLDADVTTPYNLYLYFHGIQRL